jgi:hypothetical protein
MPLVGNRAGDRYASGLGELRMRFRLPEVGTLVDVFFVAWRQFYDAGDCPRRVTFSRCSFDSHIVSHPNDYDPRKAYECKSNNAGFGGGEGKEPKELATRLVYGPIGLLATILQWVQAYALILN